MFVYQWSLRGSSFNINRIVNDLFTEWTETKFGSIYDDSDNTISIKINNIESVCNNKGFSLSGSLMIEVLLSGMVNGIELERKAMYTSIFHS
ncbi:MAG: hypothetical protein BWY18_00553 [Candidatus Cloacimonetes bacterium ADurb.Bin211]|nr:MAG: hypothetical protein BWY18_00553 [Candidatus Cloacimonetes bacterium ADurb.Bin211]